MNSAYAWNGPAPPATSFQRGRRRLWGHAGVAILLPKCLFGCCHMVSSCFIMFHYVSCSVNFNHAFSLDDDPYS